MENEWQVVAKTPGACMASKLLGIVYLEYGAL
jgi:hypothetical protein